MCIHLQWYTSRSIDASNTCSKYHAQLLFLLQLSAQLVFYLHAIFLHKFWNERSPGHCRLRSTLTRAQCIDDCRTIECERYDQDKASYIHHGLELQADRWIQEKVMIAAYRSKKAFKSPTFPWAKVPPTEQKVTLMINARKSCRQQVFRPLTHQKHGSLDC